MEQNYTSRLVVRTTDELKGAYLGLCKARGVTASDEVRAFMVEELEKALRAKMKDKPVNNAAEAKTDSPQVKNVEKCANTVDMFTSKSS
jgi:hypothetical protein